MEPRVLTESDRERLLSGSVQRLNELAGQELSLDVPFDELPVDSMDVLEWFYDLEEKFGVQFDESSLSAEDGDEVTLRYLFDCLFDLGLESAGGST